MLSLLLDIATSEQLQISAVVIIPVFNICCIIARLPHSLKYAQFLFIIKIFEHMYKYSTLNKIKIACDHIIHYFVLYLLHLQQTMQNTGGKKNNL